MRPSIVQTAGKGIKINLVTVHLIELYKTTQHNGGEPHIALLQHTERFSLSGGEFHEEIIMASGSNRLRILQILPITGKLIEQSSRLHHLPAVIGKFGTSYLTVQTHVVEVKAVCCVLQCCFSPLVQTLPFLKIGAVLRSLEKFQGKDGTRGVGTSVL